LLVLRIKSDGEIPAHAAKELHRSKPWASEWLARFAKEGVGGLKNRPKRIKERKTNKTISKDCFSDKKRITRKQGATFEGMILENYCAFLSYFSVPQKT